MSAVAGDWARCSACGSLWYPAALVRVRPLGGECSFEPRCGNTGCRSPLRAPTDAERTAWALGGWIAVKAMPL